MSAELNDRLDSIAFRSNDSVKAVVAALREAVNALEESPCSCSDENSYRGLIEHTCRRCASLSTIETLLKK